MLHSLERRGYLKSKIERSGRTFRRLYRATALGREANKLAKVQVRELIGNRYDHGRRGFLTSETEMSGLCHRLGRPPFAALQKYSGLYI